MAPLLAPPEAEPRNDDADLSENTNDRGRTEKLARPFRLGIVGFGAALGLFARLSAANGVGELNSQPLMLAAAATSAIIGIGLAMIAAERDRFSGPLVWIAAVTAAAWGALNWISPPFADTTTVWNQADQAVLALVGVGNGLLLAGLISLAFVRRGPTLTVAATMLAGVAALAANTILLRIEWPSIIALGIAFGLVLLGWDRSPRREVTFVAPVNAPRVSRAALSFLSVAFCGTALQLWISRASIPRAIPAVILCVVLLAAAFASLVRVRREIERRETTLSEWTSWMRELRTKDFRDELENFESGAEPTAAATPRSPVGFDGEAPRQLSFPNLSIPDVPSPAASPGTYGIEDIRADDLAAAAAELVGSSGASSSSPAALVELPSADTPDLGITLPSADTPALGLPSADTPRVTTRPAADRGTPAPQALPPIDPVVEAQPPPVSLPALPKADQPIGAVRTTATPTPAAEAGGAFSSMLTGDQPVAAPSVQVADLDALNRWILSPAAAARVEPLLVAVEAMSLDEFESLPPEDAAMATTEIGSFLADAMPTADLVSWIDGPYFIVAHASKPARELLELNKQVRKQLRSTDGILAFLRPGPDATLDDIVGEAVTGLLQARQHESRATR